MKNIRLGFVLCVFLTFTHIIAKPGKTGNFSDTRKDADSKEFRAVWVASVLNIDWPSKTGLSAAEQKKEFITLLDNVKKWNMNAIIVQVKPASDALYRSKLSPWSKYLSGEQGVDPGYDPLEFMIKEAHKRNIEIHAWFNPFRLSAGSASWSVLSTDNIAYKHPDWVVRYGNQLYLNPGIPEVWDYVVESIMEVVKNYKIDGIHLDDYFYPYKVGNLDYPDYKEYKKYGVTFASKADWRRNNINTFVNKLYKTIKKENESLEFGISPFGVWRNEGSDPKGSKTRALQNYDDLYADVVYWMENGWIDYIAPQLYWQRGNSAADYSTLVEWWNTMAKETQTKLYIGMAAYRVNEWKRPDELVQQVYYNRKFPEVKGNIFFSYKSLATNPKGVLTNLVSGPFASK
ncbi:MAG: family 10 glycosylhydrolase [Flavobacteriaceae bacterium]|nr:family 10 glycosylhydrolase [Flavobacteriaceae bacterium]